MKPTLIIITGDHLLVRGTLQEVVAANQKFSFFLSSEDSARFFQPHPDATDYESWLVHEEKRNEILLGEIQSGRSVIVEQWYLGLLSQSKLLDNSNSIEIEKRALIQLGLFDEVSKKVFYVSTEPENWGNEIEVKLRERQLQILTDLIKDLHLPVESINGEDPREYMKQRISFLLNHVENDI